MSQGSGDSSLISDGKGPREVRLFARILGVASVSGAVMGALVILVLSAGGEFSFVLGLTCLGALIGLVAGAVVGVLNATLVTPVVMRHGGRVSPALAWSSGVLPALAAGTLPWAIAQGSGSPQVMLTSAVAGMSALLVARGAIRWCAAPACPA